MKLTLGFSPCPNDTFIFDALVNKKIDTGEIEFDVVLEDVETLNQWALMGKLDITKLSFPAFFQSIDKYILLNSGSALGKGVGPLLISTKNIQYSIFDIQRSAVALPGLNTTANLLFSFAYPDANNKIFMRFDKIEDFVIAETSELPLSGGGGTLGVIIHENRFTYKQKGLHKVMDLGEYWEDKMKAPIPLGGIAVKRSVDRLISLEVNTLIRKSIDYAFSNFPAVSNYVKQHSQKIHEDVMRQHIELYVNNFSKDLGDEGKKAISVLFETFQSMFTPGNPSQSTGNLFLL